MPNPPNDVQQWGLAYTPKPFAALSFLSSSYVLYYLLLQHPEKLKRMYHRIVLAMSLSSLPLSFVFIWGTWAMPKETQHRIGAMGNTLTCTVAGSLGLIFAFTVPFYYASLSVFAFLAVKHSFKEAEYQWIEKWIHIGAYILPLTLAIFFAAKDQINPYGAGCYITGYPFGCEEDPDIQCERGDENNEVLLYTLGAAQFLIFVIPPAALLSIRFSVLAVREGVSRSSGFKRIMESARQRALKDVEAQTMMYLLSFWAAYILQVVEGVCRLITGEIFYDIIIVGNCLLSSQGAIIAFVYFRLNNKSKPIVMVVPNSSSYASQPNSNNLSNANQTVADIRTAAVNRGKKRILSKLASGGEFEFHIFDGTPDENSPWAQFLNPDSDDDDDVGGVSNEENMAITSEEESINGTLCDTESTCDLLDQLPTKYQTLIEGKEIVSSQLHIGRSENVLVSV